MGFGNFGKLISKILTENNVFNLLFDESQGIGRFDEIKEYEIIILAIPCQNIEAVLQNFKNDNKYPLIIDVESVKVYPKELYIKYGFQAILSHPMFGPVSYQKSGLIKKKIMVDFSLVDNVVKMSFLDHINSLGLNILERSSDLHDEITAKTLILHHIIGRSMPILKQEQLDTHLYNLLLEIQNSVLKDSNELFSSLIQYNKYAQQILNEVQQNIQNFFLNQILNISMFF